MNYKNSIYTFKDDDDDDDDDGHDDDNDELHLWED